MLASLLHLKLYLEITNLDRDSFVFEADGGQELWRLSREKLHISQESLC